VKVSKVRSTGSSKVANNSAARGFQLPVGYRIKICSYLSQQFIPRTHTANPMLLTRYSYELGLVGIAYPKHRR